MQLFVSARGQKFSKPHNNFRALPRSAHFFVFFAEGSKLFYVGHGNRHVVGFFFENCPAEHIYFTAAWTTIFCFFTNTFRSIISPNESQHSHRAPLNGARNCFEIENKFTNIPLFLRAIYIDI